MSPPKSKTDKSICTHQDEAHTSGEVCVEREEREGRREAGREQAKEERRKVPSQTQAQETVLTLKFARRLWKDWRNANCWQPTRS